MGMRIWKCDTNWGGKSILDLVVDFKIVFFGTDATRIGHYEEVCEGDLIGIAQGTRIVAIARALGRFDPLEEVGRDVLPREIIREFVIESGVAPQGCRVSSVLWLEKPVINDRRGGRFFELKPWSADYKSILKAWEQEQSAPAENKFDIAAGTKVLLGDKIAESLICSHARYVIPVYQRGYAWGEVEVLRLLEDIADGADKGEARFIGSIQVSAPRKLVGGEVSYELIDGQQRLSTLLMLLRHLGVDYTGKLRTVVNAGSAQKDWDDFRETFGRSSASRYPLNRYIQASSIIEKWLTGLCDDTNRSAKQRLLTYVSEKLLFVVIQTTAGISKTIQIFNVINTSGMDLNAADIFKIRFYEYLTRSSGPDEAMFKRISRCYQKVDDYNRDCGWTAIPMSEAMAFYQKVVVSQYALNGDLFAMASQRFFEQLFDYLLDGKKWPGFVDKGIVLTIDGFERAIDILVQMHAKSMKSGRLRLFQGLLWETRYGGVVSHYPALVCYFRTVDESDVDAIVYFAERLFKRLVAPSLYYSKVVNDVRSSKLRELLIAISRGIGDVNKILDCRWIVKAMTEEEMLERGLNQDLVYSPKWKNLACKIAEMLLAKGVPGERIYTILFETDFDIEHIQSYTDEKDRERIWREWKDELNKLGNLAMLEPGLNRSIQNETAKKEEAYAKSTFLGVKAVSKEMTNGRWTLVQAMDRRKALSKAISEYILAAHSYFD